MIGPFFSLKKSQKTFRLLHRRYLQKSKHLDSTAKDTIQVYLKELRYALLEKDSPKAKKMAKELELAAERLMPRTGFEKVKNFGAGLIFALFVAVLIRTTWFELYTIPSGSMRPTLKEDDYLVVSKTDYGINVPLKEAHFYFDEALVKRGSIVVFNGANIDIQDAKTTYFYLFPGVKQFVKRLIGKPGDTLYFYGGNIYGVDKEGNEIHDLRDNKWFNSLEHIPFIRFHGTVETSGAAYNGVFQNATFYQMNQPVAKLSLNVMGRVFGEMLEKWQKENYFDLWGMKNFAMARLLTEEELRSIHPEAKVKKGLLYLELTHHPSLKNGQILRDEHNRLRPGLGLSTSILPLEEKHLEAIQKGMTTSRFKVKNQIAWRYGWNPKGLGNYLPRLSIPDGTYEIQNGVAKTIPFPQIPILGIFTNGLSKKLPIDHPIYSKDPKFIHKLFNLGFELFNQYLPQIKNQKTVPSRYAYFKDGELYLMHQKVFSKEDPILTSFISEEKEKASISTSQTPYFPFIDQGPPSAEEILKYGITVPEKMYLVLGDNHAMSADSRQFGFVPEDNLKGGVSFLFAPIGERIGKPPAPPLPYQTFPNIFVWTLYLLIGLGLSFYYRYRIKKPLSW